MCAAPAIPDFNLLLCRPVVCSCIYSCRVGLCFSSASCNRLWARFLAGLIVVAGRLLTVGEIQTMSVLIVSPGKSVFLSMDVP